MALSQRELTSQMIAQLHALDPAASAEVGTPERMILEVVAGALADSQIDLTVLQGALDIESKFGSNLDRFIGLFGFARQDSSYATGFVEFSRITTSTTDIVIPSGTRIQAELEDRTVVFTTTYSVTLISGQTSVLVPIRAVVPGADGNVAANTIVSSVNDPIIGITGITNLTPTSGGQDSETDDQLKVRFKNTIFRNLAGTEDQYLALAAANANVTKVNIVGPISRYREYIQVPEVDDATAYDINGDSVNEAGNGSAGQYTTALSSLPYSKYIYTDVPVFVSNGGTGASAVFYRRDIDYVLNTDPTTKDRGDAHRLYSIGRASDPTSTAEPMVHQPSVTFVNVYAGAEDSVEAVRPNDVVLFEHSYLSTASRNDYARNVNNCVDVYVNSILDDLATTIIPHPTNTNLIVDNPVSKFHYESYRRTGRPETRPVVGNILMPLIYQPVTDLPPSIQVVANGVTYTFEKDVHYWAVEDITILGGSIRSRSGVEWSMDVPAVAGGSSIFITDGDIDSITVADYSYDNTVADLQLQLESAKQITTDVLAHRARKRYFKLDITVMYTPGRSTLEVNAAIRDAVQSFFESNAFGSTVQLSDLLQVVHNVPQVDNVRWTSDVPGSEDTNRIQETDRFGAPLANITTYTRRTGTTALPAIQHIILSGEPTSGNYALNYNGVWTAAIPYNANASAVLAALNAISAGIGTVTGSGTQADPFVVTFSANGAKNLIKATPYPQGISDIATVPLVNGTRNLGGSKFILDTDFYLKDNELPSLATTIDTVTEGIITDTVPGMIIRPRAQNTWGR